MTKEDGMSDGLLGMTAERKAVVDSLATHCPACNVPWGEHGCTHTFPTAEKLMASINRISLEETLREYISQMQDALRLIIRHCDGATTGAKTHGDAVADLRSIEVTARGAFPGRVVVRKTRGDDILHSGDCRVLVGPCPCPRRDGKPRT